MRAAGDELSEMDPNANVLPFRADVTTESGVSGAVDVMLDRWGGIDVLVNAVGRGHAAHLSDASAQDWLDNWRINVLSSVLLAKAVAPVMSRAGYGRIVFLGAASGKQPTEGQVVSNVHKAGVAALGATLATELASSGILVNVVCPGRTLTPRRVANAERAASAAGITADEYLSRIAATIPLGRLAAPQEVGALIVFLCSKQAGYMTGQAICVDGGLVRSI